MSKSLLLRRRAVGTQAKSNSANEHCLHRRDAAGQHHVAAGIVNASGLRFREHRDIRGVNPNAMRGYDVWSKHAQLIQPSDRRKIVRGAVVVHFLLFVSET